MPVDTAAPSLAGGGGVGGADGKYNKPVDETLPPSSPHRVADGDTDLDRQVIESASAPGEDDEFDVEDGLPNDETTSVATSVYACTYENGRRYHHFKNGRYPIPDDDTEQDREDMKHAMLMELTDGTLFYAPVGNHPNAILDIGTGTGIWAIEVGDKYPSAHVTGIDLSPIQPVWVPSNVEFIVDDCERDWLSRDVDLVHFRFMSIVLKDVPGVLGHAYESLRSGGWVEMHELHGVPFCDDDTMPDDDPVKSLYDIAAKAYTKFGMNVRLPATLDKPLRDAGFVNIQRRVIKTPIGPWARDKILRLAGHYQKVAVREFIPTLAGRPFEALGMSKAESQVAVALARKALEDLSVHRYFNYYFWFAQKPESSS